MKKYLLPVIALSMLLSLAGCISKEYSLKATDLSVMGDKRSTFGYLYASYFYRDKPFGARIFCVTVVHNGSAKEEPFNIIFDNKNQKDVFVYNLKPGKYTFLKVCYLPYSEKDVNLEIDVEANKIYYLGNYEIVQVPKTTMIDSNTRGVMLLDDIISRQSTWDYLFKNNFDEDVRVLKEKFAALADMKVEKMIK